VHEPGTNGFGPLGPKPSQRKKPLADKLPPHNLDLEMSLLGSLIVSNSLYPEIADFLRGSDLYRAAHQRIFGLIGVLIRDGAPADLISLCDLVKSRGLEDEIEARYLEELCERALPASAVYHAGIVKQHSVKRQLIEIGKEIVSKGYAEDVNAEALYGFATGRIEQMFSANARGDSDLTISFDRIVESELRWLWPGRVPIECLTTFAGPGGLGKSMVTIDMISRITTGRPWPDAPDIAQEVGSCLLVNTEDPLESVTRMRLRVAGADPRLVRTFTDAALAEYRLADIAMLERAIGETPGLKLVVIDPPTALTGGIDDHKNAPLRGLLAPLAAFAARHKIAIVMITHVAKAATQHAADKVIGSVAWVNAVRAACAFYADKDVKGRVRFLAMKANLGPKVGGLAYRIPADSPRVEWETDLEDMDADQANEESGPAKRGRKPAPTSKAASWLYELLRDGLPMMLKDVFERARGDGVMPGESPSPLYDARRKLPEAFPGYQVHQFEAPSGSNPNRQYKHWQLIRKDGQEIDNGQSGVTW
jgi:putative DNA primase/helicase